MGLVVVAVVSTLRSASSLVIMGTSLTTHLIVYVRYKAEDSNRRPPACLPIFNSKLD